MCEIISIKITNHHPVSPHTIIKTTHTKLSNFCDYVTCETSSLPLHCMWYCYGNKYKLTDKFGEGVTKAKPK